MTKAETATVCQAITVTLYTMEWTTETGTKLEGKEDEAQK